jgi:hypothetical protein
MARTLSAPAFRAMFAQETGEVFLLCLTLSHPNWPAPLRVVYDNQPVTRGSGQAKMDPATMALWRLDETIASAAAVDAVGVYNLPVGGAGSPAVAVGQVGGARAVLQNADFQGPDLGIVDAAVAVAQSGTYTCDGWFWVDPTMAYPATWPGPGNNHAFLLALGPNSGTALGFGLGPTSFFHYNPTSGFVNLGVWSGATAGWHHLAVRCTSTDATHMTLDCFLDGVKVATQANVLKYAVTPTAPVTWRLGAEAPNFNSFVGRLDDMRFSKTARTDADIADTYLRAKSSTVGTYSPAMFQISLPEDSPDKVPTVTLTIDNTDRAITDLIRQVSGSRVTVLMDVVLASSPNTVEAGPFLFQAVSCQYNAQSVTVTLGFEEDILNSEFPCVRYTPQNSPGMFK